MGQLLVTCDWTGTYVSENQVSGTYTSIEKLVEGKFNMALGAAPLRKIINYGKDLAKNYWVSKNTDFGFSEFHGVMG